MAETVLRPSINMRSFDASLPMALLRARETAMALFRPLLAEYDLTEQQWRVLRALAASEVPIDASKLADETFLLAPSLSRMLTALDERELITRQTDPADHRRTLILLSDHGEALVQKVAPHSEARYARIEQSFGAERLQVLLQELHELAALDLDASSGGVS